MKFALAFANFILLAAFCAVGVVGIIFATLAEARAHQPESTRALDMPRMSGEARAVPPSGGDLRRPTAGKLAKRAGLTPRKDEDFARTSSPRNQERDGGSMARAQGWHFAPQSVKSGCCAVGQEFDSPRLHGGALVSTAGGIPMETAEARGLANQPETNTRRIRVEAGGLTATARDAGSLGHRNQPYQPHDSTVRRSSAVPDPRVTSTPRLRSDGNAASQGLPMRLGVTAGETALRQMATDAANLCGVPVALFHALIERESSWRPHVVSSAGAVGLAQVKPSTGRGVSPTLDVREPWQNLVAGACYLRQQFDRFGTWRAALHAYRVGPNARPSKVARDYAADIIQGSAQ